MEEFDRYIKSKINSINEVPGISFDEEKVWRGVKTKTNNGLIYSLIALLLIAFVGITFLLTKEDAPQLLQGHPNNQSTNQVLAETNNVPLKKNSQTASQEAKDIVVAEKPKLRKDKQPKTAIGQVDSIDEIKSISTIDQTSSLPQPIVPALARTKPEASKPLDQLNQKATSNAPQRSGRRLSLTYGLQFNGSFNQRFDSEGDPTPHYPKNQIQVPFGLRYDFIKGDRRFKPHLYAGLTSVFGFPVENTGSSYDLRFESTLNLDYRIFSTEDGKRGYLRLRLPIFNKSLINPNAYQPWLFNTRGMN